MSQLVEITATVEYEKWRREDFFIGEAVLVKSHDDRDPRRFGIKGTAGENEIVPSVEYRFYGTWDKSSPGAKRYGPSFAFQTYVLAKPVSRRGIIAYLSEAGKGHGLGPRTAEKLFEKFGERAVDVCREQPEVAAAAVNRWPLDKAQKVAEILNEYAHIQTAWIEVKELLEGRGFPRTVAKQSLKRWGSLAPAIISRDPYKLMAFRGVGFLKCDSFYKDLGLNPAALKRQAYSIAYEVASSTEGHCWLPADQARASLKGRVGDAKIEPDKAIELARRGRIIRTRLDHYGRMWIADARDAAAEETVARLIAETADETAQWPEVEWSTDMDGRPTQHQHDELLKATRGTVGLFCGSPGTGKTHTTAFLVKALIEKYGVASIAIAAPTGKAAVRCNESFARYNLPMRAKTIHSLLGVETSEGGWTFTHNANNPLPYQFILLDECFPAGTLVDTPDGPRAIETIQPGDAIYNAAGEDVVVATSKKQVTHAVRINCEGQEITCTASHPFFTERGLVIAGELRPGDRIARTGEAMRLLRSIDHARESKELESPVLQHPLLNALVAAVSGVSGANLHERTPQEMRRSEKAVSEQRERQGAAADRTNSQPEPDEQSRISPQVVGAIASDRAQAEGIGWERPAVASAAAATTCRAWEWLDVRTGDFPREENAWISEPLQDRHCEPDAENRNRVRRPVSLLTESKGSRREEGCSAGFVRVDSVAVLEPSDNDLDQFRDATGALYFYDLQVLQHHSFSVSGMLVHNCSMVDISLMSSFLQARARGAHVLFVGDPNQLPPVGRGAPLRDFIAACLPYGELTEIHRNAGTIVRACHAIKDGKPWPTDTDVDPDATPPRNLVMVHASKSTTKTKLLDVVAGIKDSGCVDPIWDVQVCVAVNKRSELSRQKLNEELQGILNPAGQTVQGSPFRVGDKVMVTKNSFFPDAEDQDEKTWVANGEFGRVLEVAEKKTIIQFENPKRVVLVPRGKQDKPSSDEKDEGEGTGCDVVLGFAATVHKMQGSSAPIVIVAIDEYPCATGSMGICDRNWLYTAISRAERLCYLVGSRTTANAICNRVYITRRKTYLVEDILSNLEKFGLRFPQPGDELFDPARFDERCFEPIT